jgi:hypothetical protein
LLKDFSFIISQNEAQYSDTFITLTHNSVNGELYISENPIEFTNCNYPQLNGVSFTAEYGADVNLFLSLEINSFYIKRKH